jgi:hypothetical protein
MKHPRCPNGTRRNVKTEKCEANAKKTQKKHDKKIESVKVKKETSPKKMNTPPTTSTFYSYVKSHPEKKWFYQNLSMNPNITIEDVMQDMDKQWNFSILTERSTTYMRDIDNHPDFPWDNISLSRNPNITMEDIETHTNIKWYLTGLSDNTNLNMDFVIKHKDDLVIKNKDVGRIGWNYPSLSANECIQLEDVLKNPKIKWDKQALLLNPSISFKKFMDNKLFFKKMGLRNFGFYLSHNPNIHFDDVFANPKIKWSFDGLSQNKNINIDIVLSHLEKEWNWRYLSSNPQITFKNILDNIELPWEYNYVSENPNVSMKDVLEHPEIKWDVVALSKNPNITFQDVDANPQFEWDYINLSKNPMNEPKKI